MDAQNNKKYQRSRTPEWAIRIIKLFKAQNERLETISNEANRIADASNKIANKTLAITIATIVLGVVALLLSYRANKIVEQQFSDSIELQKRSILLQEVLSRQDQIMTTLTDAENQLDLAKSLCSAFPVFELLDIKNQDLLTKEKAKEIFDNILRIRLTAANLNRNMYAISNTLLLFPNSRFQHISRPFEYRNNDPRIPYEMNKELFEASLQMFYVELKEALELDKFKEWQEWYHSILTNPPSDLYTEDEEIYFAHDMTHEADIFDDYYDQIYEFKVILEFAYDVFKDPSFYMMAESFEIDERKNMEFNMFDSLKSHSIDYESQNYFYNERPCSLYARKARFNYLIETDSLDEYLRNKDSDFESWSKQQKQGVQEVMDRARKRIENEK